MDNLKQNVIEVLSYELQKRKKANGQYSLRSFASYLGIDYSTLSKALRGERSLGPKYQQKCLDRLNLSTKDLIPEVAINKKSYHFVESDQFKLLSSWNHLAIAEALKIKKYQSNWKLLQTRFKLNLKELKESLDVLKANGFIKLKGKSVEVTQPDTSCISKNTTSFTRKEYLKSVFSKSLSAIDEVDFSDRDHSALTVLANREQIDDIKEEINKFRHKIDAILEGVEGKQDVYQLTIGFSPLTYKTGEKK